MPRLTVPELRAARHSGRVTEGGKKRPERVPDGDGLYLQITPEGAKSWLFRFSFAGKAREMGLGSVALTDDRRGLTLANARREVARLALAVREGRDPIHERDARRAEAIAAVEAEVKEAKQKGRTFRDVAEIVLTKVERERTNAKHQYQWRQSLESYAFPLIGDMPVADVTVADVLRVLTPIWESKTETAQRLRGRIERVLTVAAAMGLRPRDQNPAVWRGNLKEILPAPSRVATVQHQPALDMAEVPAFLKALRAREGVAALSLEFCILTAARSGEVRGARWAEMNLADEVWEVPADRMKARKPHRVPLTAAALAVLKEVEPLRQTATPEALVFPGSREGKALSDMTLAAVIKRMNGKSDPPAWRDKAGNAVVPHGFRAAFKQWALVQGWADHLSEMALAHQDANKVRAAYAREDLLAERRPMMEAWARFCTASAGQAVVVPLRTAKG
ncbi:tyrosine-type recombinase/integrase [Roseococcus sp. SDR]|uniref:tyrosine-type recombinase/integrase n=1 Tax=Roseococcus sp. SDR TaxID=2835532 RepID=UPI001BCBCDA5|nr:site-specific integrase [Roseococcus sp. SDR]MBS7790108.1 tyrosine-type recombinase/integrase [Roseococcus sp. SDR]MBV1845422.1 tyrosine-type recombinase/integrase [Roseococcus sp. SDR]